MIIFLAFKDKKFLILCNYKNKLQHTNLTFGGFAIIKRGDYPYERQQVGTIFEKGEKIMRIHSGICRFSHK